MKKISPIGANNTKTSYLAQAPRRLCGEIDLNELVKEKRSKGGTSELLENMDIKLPSPLRSRDEG